MKLTVLVLLAIVFMSGCSTPQVKKQTPTTPMGIPQFDVIFPGIIDSFRSK